MKAAISVENLTKKFGDFTAVDHISFEVEQGEVFGFLGPNGAGKTTTTRMLTGISTPTEGTATIMGHDILHHAFAAKERMGVVTDLSNVYNDLSAWDNLIFTAKLYGLEKHHREEKAAELLDMFGLQEVRDDNVREFSGGMKRRLTIAMALINDADVLFLDEPTTALDVQSVRTIRGLIRELNENGTTIFLTTHNMQEANELCSTIAIINQGKIGKIGTPEELKQAMEKMHSVEIAFDSGRQSLAADLERIEGVREVQKRGDKFRLFTLTPPDTLSGVFSFARERGLQLLTVNTLGPTLEDVFVELTGEEIVHRGDFQTSKKKKRRK
ncbi:ATP-binding cassette domain-containing protein [Candidatus Thorarchaeota archaeon]|nr:MAG: ATP-binding cassette domain-containing protein [Candidatus Thorarchaeota archaeon]